VSSNRLKLVGVLLLVGLLLGAGGVAPSWAQSGRTVVDDRGREIAVPPKVERVVVAGTPLFTEILVDLGALDKLVGVTTSPDNPPEVAAIAEVGPSFPSPNIERIVELNPDVVFGAVFDARDRLEAAGLTVITPVGFITSVADLFTVIRAVGLVVDRAAQADRLVGQISEGIVRLESRVAQQTPKRAAFVFAAAGNPPFASGRGSFEGELLARAGGLNVFSDLEGGGVISLETLVARNPEVIFTDRSQVENITGNPLLQNVAAVKSGHVVGVKASSLTSTRVVDTLAALAKALHPEAFAIAQGS